MFCFFSCKYLSCNTLAANVEFVPLSLIKVFKYPFLEVNLFNAFKNDSADKEFLFFKCIALTLRHVKKEI